MLSIVINASHFCGKVIEDQAIAVTIGCYVTHVCICVCVYHNMYIYKSS